MIIFKGSDIKDLMILGQRQEKEKEMEKEVQQEKQQAKDDPKPKQEEEEIDFEKLNMKFTKMQLKNNYQKYDQKSFFDNISCSTTEKNRETREDRQK